MKKKNFLPILVVAVILFILGGWVISRAGKSSGSASTSKPAAETNLNQKVWVMGRNEKGAATENWVELSFTKAEKSKSVLVKGQPATAKDDKFFLVVYFEVKNDSERLLYTLPVDLVRLVKPDGKLFAPSVHQNLVELRPISTKVTNVGFVVEKNEKEFTLMVGEVGGGKTDIKVNF